MANVMQELDNAILNAENEIEYYKEQVLAANKPKYVEPPRPVIKMMVARLRNKLERKQAELAYYKQIALLEGVPKYRGENVPAIETPVNGWKDGNPYDWTNQLYRENKPRRRIY